MDEGREAVFELVLSVLVFMATHLAWLVGCEGSLLAATVSLILLKLYGATFSWAWPVVAGLLALLVFCALAAVLAGACFFSQMR